MEEENPGDYVRNKLFAYIKDFNERFLRENEDLAEEIDETAKKVSNPLPEPNRYLYQGRLSTKEFPNNIAEPVLRNNVCSGGEQVIEELTGLVEEEDELTREDVYGVIEDVYDEEEYIRSIEETSIENYAVRSMVSKDVLGELNEEEREEFEAGIGEYRSAVKKYMEELAQKEAEIIFS